MPNYTDKKYVMIVTSEDERYGKEVQLDFYADSPWEGKLVDIVFGDNWEELFGNGENEGLFYQLYSTATGKRIGYGSIHPDYTAEDIEMFEDMEDEPKKDWKEIVTDVAEGLNWNAKFDDDENWFTFSTCSSAGQDFDINVEADNLKVLKTELSNYCDNFDISYEAYLWLDHSGHGKNGAPYEMIDVYKDMEECLEAAKELSYKINQLKDESEE